MRNCVILGAGRSGTSLVAGLLRSAGYNYGPDLLEPDASNPRGYFESSRINDVNEAILADCGLPWWLEPFANHLGFRDAGRGLRWLNQVPAHWPLQADAEQKRVIRRLTRNEPFCFKDPRFSYTLPCWASALEDPVVLYVVRHPLGAARSLVKHARRRGYAERLGMDLEEALAVWRATNRYALTNSYGTVGEWRIVMFHDFFGGAAVNVVEAALGVTADTSHIDRSAPDFVGGEAVPQDCRALYRTLDELATLSGQAA